MTQLIHPVISIQMYGYDRVDQLSHPSHRSISIIDSQFAIPLRETCLNQCHHVRRQALTHCEASVVGQDLYKQGVAYATALIIDEVDIVLHEHCRISAVPLLKPTWLVPQEEQTG